MVVYNTCIYTLDHGEIRSTSLTGRKKITPKTFKVEKMAQFQCREMFLL